MEAQIEQFFTRADSDAALRMQLANAQDNDEVIRLAASLGFQFTKQEYEKRLDDALGIDDLDGGGAVMSGIANCPSHWPT